MEWVDDNSDRQICWLGGPPGFGKTAIAQSIAEQCVTRQALAASFFFRRGAENRSDTTRFIPTLADQLTLSIPDAKSSIQTVREKDHTIFGQSLDDQLQKLIINPVLSNTPPSRMVVVVDALDECEDKDDIVVFIEALLRASRERRLPFRFFVTGRAENHIVQSFSAPGANSVMYRMDLQNFNARVDIRTFFQSRFSNFLESENSRLIRNDQTPWPAASDFEGLVEMSSGIFIVASTLVDFITSREGTPQQKLEQVLSAGPASGLDGLYNWIFAAANRVGYFDRVIGTIMLLREQLSIPELGCLLRLTAAEILQALVEIQSILRIPPDDKTPIQLVHTSLPDYLTKEKCSGSYFIDPLACHNAITVNCLEMMKDLKAIMDDPQQDIFTTVGAHQYACRNWCYHLAATLIKGKPSGDLISSLKDFMSQSLSPWVDMLICIQCATETTKFLYGILGQKVSPMLHIFYYLETF
jgi:hypothetical protein